MQGLLLRVGIDQEFGGCNAPVDPDSREFIYLPIPEDLARFRAGMATTYDDFVAPVTRFADGRAIDNAVEIPAWLLGKGCHLDPDFDHLTYGDQPDGRGRKVSRLTAGDFIVFFASLKPVRACNDKLLYSLIGIFFVKQVLRVRELSEDMWKRNAHSRRKDNNGDDVVVVADPDRSGRFQNCLPIGTYRDRAYRVREDLLSLWRGLDVKNGFIQRSVNPPSFLDPSAFLRWLSQQDTGAVLHHNN